MPREACMDLQGGAYMQAEPKTLSIEDLRAKWTGLWGIEPHNRIGRAMLEKSIEYKQHARELTPDQQKRLKKLIAAYKRSPKNFENNTLKPGTRLERVYHGRMHSVVVTRQGYEYQGIEYKSLSKIANEITGSKWNGWVFFGLKKAGT